MNNKVSNEQWKTDGKCSVCRRKAYCKKSCSANKKGFQREVGRALASTKVGAAMLAVSAMTGFDYGKGKL